jgi:hypothetical protein
MAFNPHQIILVSSINEDEISKARDTWGGEKKCMLCPERGTTKCKKTLGEHRSRWEDNVETDL